MGTLQNFFNFFGTNKTPNVVPNVTIGRQDFIRAALLGQATGNKNSDIDLKKAEIISSVYTCIKLLAENVSRLPLNIYQEAGSKKSILQSHSYYNQLRFNPQTWVNTKDWLTSIITCLYLRGNAYAFIAKDQFRVLNPDGVDMGIYKNQLWYTSGEIEDEKGQRIPFMPEDILHFRLITKDPLGKGMNPIESLRTELNLHFKSEKTVESNYNNNAFGEIYMQQIADMGKTGNIKLAEVVEDFANKFSGFENSGTVKIVPPGFQLESLRLNNLDTEILNSAGFSIARISALFGVPLYLMNQEANYQGKFEDAILNFRSNTLSALMNCITSELEFKLLTEKEKTNGICIEFDSKLLIETSLIDKANTYKMLFQMGAVTPNQVATAFHVEASNDPALDKNYIQMQNFALQDGNPMKSAPVTNNNTNQDSNSNDPQNN